MKWPIECDKVLHFIAGMAVFAAAILVLSSWQSIGCVIAAGAGKELWDANHPNHTVDWHDFKWTVIGGLTFCGWLYIYEFVKSQI